MIHCEPKGLYTGYIYCITNIVNGKCYVGQTIRTIADRWKDHRYAAANGEDGSILYRAIRLYGVESFRVEELCKITANTPEELHSALNDQESHYIAKLGTYKPDGYNMTLGGQNAANVEKGVICVMSNGDVVAKYRSAADAGRMTGIKPYNITMACRDSSTHSSCGYFWYYDTDIAADVGGNIGVQKLHRNKPVRQFTTDGVLVAMYNSPAEASNLTDIDAGKIRSVCNGKRMSAGGYIWSYFDVIDGYNPQKNRVKAVQQMDMSGNVINVFDSIRRAEAELGIDHSLISACCKGKRKSTGGYRWAFIM